MCFEPAERAIKGMTMKTTIFILVMALVAGCSNMTQPEDIAVAEDLCSKRGGYAQVIRFERGDNLVINCKDGTHIDLRPGKKA